MNDYLVSQGLEPGSSEALTTAERLIQSTNAEPNSILGMEDNYNEREAVTTQQQAAEVSLPQDEDITIEHVKIEEAEKEEDGYDSDMED